MSGCCEYGSHDVEFRQLLEEARQQAVVAGEETTKYGSSSLPQEEGEEGGRRRAEGDDQKKSHWKNSLFKWWKPAHNRKGKPPPPTNYVAAASSSPMAVPNSFGKDRVASTGPINNDIVYGSGSSSSGGVDHKARRHRLPTSSGPLLSNRFNLSNIIKGSVQHEIPYVGLDQQQVDISSDPNATSYGPVYLVT